MTDAGTGLGRGAGPGTGPDAGARGGPGGGLRGEPGDRFSVAGRVVVVTGAGRGIGRAIALGMAGSGAQVVVTARTADACAAVVAEIEAAEGSAVAVPGDVGAAADRERLVSAAVESFGRLDVVVNNAGVLRPHHVVKVTEDELDEIFRTNVTGPVLLAQLAYPRLIAGGGESIINVSALGAFQPMAGIGAYCASKAAMVNWTMTMSKEWAPQGVRVNLLVPGPVATDMILPRDPDRRAGFVEEMAGQTLVGRIAEPDDLVGAAIFLASDASAFMTGRSLFVDGGMLA